MPALTKVSVKWIPKDLQNRPEWDKASMKTVLPLLREAQLLAETIRTRVVTKSEDAYGKKFGKYAENKTDTYVYWTQPWMPGGSDAPLTLGAVKVITFSGRVGYHSSRAYHETVLGKKHKNFYLSGGLWESLRVRPMTPYKVRIAFYGSSKDHGGRARSTRNSDKAFYPTRSQRAGLLWISDKEAERVYKYIAETYDAKISTLIREDAARFKVHRVAARLERNMKKEEAKWLAVKAEFKKKK